MPCLLREPFDLLVLYPSQDTDTRTCHASHLSSWRGSILSLERGTPLGPLCDFLIDDRNAAEAGNSFVEKLDAQCALLEAILLKAPHLRAQCAAPPAPNSRLPSDFIMHAHCTLTGSLG